MRDARAVTDVLLAGDDWSAAAFEGYAQERSERMRRLRVVVHVATELRCTFTPEGQARRVAFSGQMMSDGLMLGLMLSSLAGPEMGPAESFEAENVQRILALA